MSVSMVRLKNGEQISNLDTINSIARQNKRKYNQWELADLSIYHFYCCPECSYRSPKDFLFRDHMNENHETVISKKIKTSVSSLIQRFLEDEKDIQSRYNELNLPENIDVIKNPHFKLPLPNFSQSSPETSAIFQSQSLNNSNETATSQFSITIIERKHSTEDESESNDENYEPNDFQADSGDYHELMSESLPGIIDEQENKPEVLETKPKLPSMDKDSKKCQDCSIVFLTPFRLQRHIKKFHGKY